MLVVMVMVKEENENETLFEEGCCLQTKRPGHVCFHLCEKGSLLHHFLMKATRLVDNFATIFSPLLIVLYHSLSSHCPGSNDSPFSCSFPAAPHTRT